MIGRLTGVIVEKSPPMLLLDVNGVGYEISASMNTFAKLPNENEVATLYIHMQTREDGSYLYGFIDDKERTIFKELVKVSGVGPRLALTILSGMDIATLGNCIIERQVARLIKLPGVGKKTAERLVVELHDKLNKLSGSGKIFSQILIASEVGDSEAAGVQEAIAALEALGYKSTEAKKAIDKIYDPDHSRDDMIRMALKALSA